MLAYNVRVGNEVYRIVSPSEDEAIKYAIKLYKAEYNKDVSIEDCKIVWDYVDEVYEE